MPGSPPLTLKRSHSVDDGTISSRSPFSPSEAVCGPECPFAKLDIRSAVFIWAVHFSCRSDRTQRGSLQEDVSLWTPSSIQVIALKVSSAVPKENRIHLRAK